LLHIRYDMPILQSDASLQPELEPLADFQMESADTSKLMAPDPLELHMKAALRLPDSTIRREHFVKY
jgi:hypothetical protein